MAVLCEGYVKVLGREAKLVAVEKTVLASAVAILIMMSCRCGGLKDVY